MVMVMVIMMVVVMRNVMEDDWRLSFTKLEQPTSNGSPENSDDNGLTTIRQVLYYLVTQRKKNKVQILYLFLFIQKTNYQQINM